jgi:hypothetical protein
MQSINTYAVHVGYDLAICDAELTDEMYNELIRNIDVKVRVAVAARYDAPANILGFLCLDSDYTVRYEVANNDGGNVSEAMFRQLLKENNRDITMAIARNCTTPLILLEELSRSSDYCLACLAVENYRDQYNQ